MSSERYSGFGGTVLFAALALIARAPVGVVAAPVGTAFNYQGQLKEGSVPFDGTADFQFTLWDAAGSGNPPTGGTQVGGVQAINALPVTAGLFNVTLNSGGEFGPSAFNGDDRWLEVHVNGTPLAPRQPLTPTPYALKVPGIDGHSLDAADGNPTDALFVDNAGNVGIGTISPAYPLDLFSGSFPAANVRSDNTVGTWLNLGNTSAGGSNWQLISTGSNNGGGPGQLLLGTGPIPNNSSPVMTLSPTGKVGIGTLSPDNWLHVHKGSAGTITGHANAPLVVENSTNAYINLLTPDANERGILFGEPSNIAAGAIIYNAPATPEGLQFRTGGNVNRMVIDSAGKVGIGTNTMFGKLDVRDEGQFLAHLDGTSTRGAWLSIKSSTLDGRVWGIVSTSTDNGEGPGDLVFYDGTTGITRMDIDGPTGNVGIGTAAPGGRLEVNGGIRARGGAPGPFGANDNGYAFSGATGDDDGGMFSSANGQLELYTNAVERVRVDGGGNVGIGTGSPDNRLHVMKGSAGAVTGHANAALVVENSTTTYINLLTPDANERGILFGETSSNVAGGIIYNASTTPDGFQFRTSGNSTKMVIDASGNVGIGETAPGARLDVAQALSHVAQFNRTGDEGVLVYFQQDGINKGNISVSGAIVSYNAFTGSHYAWSDATHQPGQLVSMTGQNRRYEDRPDAEVMYGIRTTSLANDPACLGAYLGLEESAKAPAADNPLLVAAVGNGDMWVIDRGGGDIEPGDYLISSEVPGCAMKDDPIRFPVGYIVARAAERVEWANVPADDQGVRRAKISVLFGNFIRMGSVEAMNARMDRLQRELENVRTERDAAIAELKERLARLESPSRVPLLCQQW